MKVYRCLNEKPELILFQNNIITSERCNSELKEITLNTHDYGENDVGFLKKLKGERKHFFIFKEDAVNYMKNYLEHDCLIGEYDIPEDLVISNIGIGIYSLSDNQIVLETAIPYADILRKVNYEHYLFYYDYFANGDLNNKHLFWRMDITQKLNLDYAPIRMVECEYPIRTIDPKTIELSLLYDLFLENEEFNNIFNLLGIESIKQNHIKNPDFKQIREILLNYDLLEEKNIGKVLNIIK